jgi:GTP-binding protein EngB required for normal cell division
LLEIKEKLHQLVISHDASTATAASTPSTKKIDSPKLPTVLLIGTSNVKRIKEDKSKLLRKLTNK